MKVKAAKKSKDAAMRLERYAEAMLKRWNAWPEPVFSSDPQLHAWQAKVGAMQAVVNGWPGDRIRTVVLLNACLVMAEDMRQVSKVPEWESICQTLATLTGHADPALEDEAGQEDGLKMAEKLMEVIG
jgi:hypothetical protein